VKDLPLGVFSVYSTDFDLLLDVVVVHLHF
jgi:hypothetical protein